MISACLLGLTVRYNGTGFEINNEIIEQWQKEGRLILYCPETNAGLPTPRFQAEINGLDGKDVILGNGKVIDINGNDVTNCFIKGALEALQIVKQYRVKYAIFKDGSPSCGCRHIYDGTFSGKKKYGNGVMTALLKRYKICVFNEREIKKVHSLLQKRIKKQKASLKTSIFNEY